MEQAGVRLAAESLLESILLAYAGGDVSTRQSIRAIFAENRSFAWAAVPPHEATSRYGLRLRLLLTSAVDQAQDLRDAASYVRKLCVNASEAGVDVAPIVSEAVSLSSDVPNNQGLSVARILRNAC